jgi:flagella basal body P-ring formation protein FlgA
MRRLPIIAMLLVAFETQAASLRIMTTLTGPTVLLRDLFDDPGSNSERVLGPGPAPGGRIIVESSQLGAIARMYGVDWRPASRADRAMLEWPGRPLRREDALAAVREALIAAGASQDCTIELPGFNAPIVPADAMPRPIVAQLDYDSGTGRFTALLSIVGAGMEPINTRISGHADDTVELPVATSRLPNGAVLRAEDIHMIRVNTYAVRGEVAHAPAQAVGMQTKRQLIAGQPIALADLMRPNAVQRGAVVQMSLAVNGLSVVGQGQAMEAGATGERIRVQNMVSRAVVEAEVLGPGKVRVNPVPGSVQVGTR